MSTSEVSKFSINNNNYYYNNVYIHLLESINSTPNIL
jgi:hypothetical protein